MGCGGGGVVEGGWGVVGAGWWREGGAWWECSLVPRPSLLCTHIIRATFEPLDIENRFSMSRGSKVARIINAHSREGLGTRLVGMITCASVLGYSMAC